MELEDSFEENQINFVVKSFDNDGNLVTPWGKLFSDVEIHPQSSVQISKDVLVGHKTSEEEQ
jgi:hypothetical protein